MVEQLLQYDAQHNGWPEAVVAPDTSSQPKQVATSALCDLRPLLKADVARVMKALAQARKRWPSDVILSEAGVETPDVTPGGDAANGDSDDEPAV